ncbi:hypothetical protein M2360_000839 [Rhizobium sp. SG_E_25_P2]|nr:hypothetical protein [Rhizobium sp. SG_E_25_P2]
MGGGGDAAFIRALVSSELVGAKGGAVPTEDFVDITGYLVCLISQ